jgi:hypothetical protein
MNCINCHESITEDPGYPRAISYGYRHENGSLFCSSAVKHTHLARPEKS